MIDVQWLPISAATLQKPSAFPAGTLLAMAPLSGKGTRISWALRFDDSTGDAVTPCLYLVNGSPIGPDGENTIVRCQDAHIDEFAAVGLGAPTFAIEIEVDPKDWILDHELLWYHAKAHVALGDFGVRLCGYDRYRTGGSIVWIDCKTWQADLEVTKQLGPRTTIPSAYAKTWRVIARRSVNDALAIGFEPPEKQS